MKIKSFFKFNFFKFFIFLILIFLPIISDRIYINFFYNPLEENMNLPITSYLNFPIDFIVKYLINVCESVSSSMVCISNPFLIILSFVIKFFYYYIIAIFLYFLLKGVGNKIRGRLGMNEIDNKIENESNTVSKYN